MMEQPPDFTASMLPADSSDYAEIQLAALLRCAAVLLERGRMLTAERQAINAELCEIGERLQRLSQQNGHAPADRCGALGR
jgi:hypothetical protein